jgi:hypothetical protein
MPRLLQSRGWRIRRNQVRVLALCLALGSACGSATAPEPSYVGSYALQSMGGKTLPINQLSADGTIGTLTSASFILRADGTFFHSVPWVLTKGGVSTPQGVAFSGTYTLKGDSVTFNQPFPTSSGGVEIGVSLGRFSGNTLTYAGDEIYIKQ